MASRAVFPLRWRNERLRTLTAEVAARLGISQNELIEQAIEHEVVARGAMLSEDLRAAADRLAELTQEQYERMQARGLESFVAGEGQLSRFKLERRCLLPLSIVSPSTILYSPGTSRRSTDRHALGWHDGSVVAGRRPEESPPHSGKRRAADP